VSDPQVAVEVAGVRFGRFGASGWYRWNGSWAPVPEPLWTEPMLDKVARLQAKIDAWADADERASTPKVTPLPSASDCKVAVCEYLLAVNADFPDWPPLIPPTAIDWLGDGIVAALIAAATPKEDDRAE